MLMHSGLIFYFIFKLQHTKIHTYEAFLSAVSKTSPLENEVLVIFHFTHSDAYAGFIYKNIIVKYVIVTPIFKNAITVILSGHTGRVKRNCKCILK